MCGCYRKQVLVGPQWSILPESVENIQVDGLRLGFTDRIGILFPLLPQREL